MGLCGVHGVMNLLNLLRRYTRARSASRVQSPRLVLASTGQAENSRALQTVAICGLLSWWSHLLTLQDARILEHALGHGEFDNELVDQWAQLGPLRIF
jgi:hypothetical protein